MLNSVLNEAIAEMKTVQGLENASADTKKQAAADYDFKQLINSLKIMIEEIQMAMNNSSFKPSFQTIATLQSFISSCDKIVDSRMAIEGVTKEIEMEAKKVYSSLSIEWTNYYEEYTQHTLNLLDTIKEIVPEQNKVNYATNKIRKASGWNRTLDNYNYLKAGLEEAEQIISGLELEENPGVLEFLKLVGVGKATIADLNSDILKWIISENLQNKMKIVFSE